MTRFKLDRRTMIAAGFAAVTLGGARAQEASRLPAIQRAGEIRIGWGEFPPFETRDVISGELKGVLIDLAKEIARVLKAKPDFVLDSWPTMTAGIAAARFDIALMGYSDGRASVCDFSRRLYNTEWTAIVQKASGVTRWADLNQSGKTIAVTTGSSTDEEFRRMEQDGRMKAEVTRIRDVGAAILAVTSGNVHGYANQRDVLSLVEARQPQIGLLADAFGETWFGVVMPKGDAELKRAVDNAIVELIRTNVIADLIAKHNVKGATQAQI